MLNFFAETFLLGLKNLRLHKLRSLLTALGHYSRRRSRDRNGGDRRRNKAAGARADQPSGAKNILIRSVKPPESNQASNRTQRVLDYGLKRVDLDRLKTLPEPDDGGAAARHRAERSRRRHRRSRRQRDRHDAGYLRRHQPSPWRGSFFDQLQYDRADAVCVLGNKVARDLFPYQDPIGQTVQIGSSGMACTICTVVGVLEPTGLRRLRRREHDGARPRRGHLLSAEPGAYHLR